MSGIPMTVPADFSALRAGDSAYVDNVTDTYTACPAHLAWAQDAADVDPVALCYQTGCHARKGSDPQGYPVLGCPNREAAQALSRL